MTGGASFSPCGGYRYRLWRRWSSGPSQKRQVLWLMLNPSTADEQRNDPTIRRCINYPHNWGYNHMEVCNLFAWRATRPRDLFSAVDPVGPQNDNILRRQIRRADLIMVAWGVYGSRRDRDAEVIQILQKLQVEVYCLGVTKHGAPRHPLFLKKSLSPEIKAKASMWSFE